MKKPDILFENENFLVVDKPAGVLAVPGREGEKDARPVLNALLEMDSLFTVHRLDFEVSGLVLIAKNKEAHKAANTWFENSEVQKTYVAYTEAKAHKTEFTPLTLKLNSEKLPQTFHWEMKLQRGKKRSFISPQGKVSITDATCESTQKEGEETFLCWSLFPKTGRSHQLRVALSAHGYPILGDSLYGSVKKNCIDHDEHIALKAVSLNFLACKGFESWGLPQEIKLERIA